MGHQVQNGVKREWRERGWKVLAFFLIAFAVAGGYAVRALRHDAELKLPLDRFPPPEYYSAGPSFSEVDHAKLTLEALGCETLTELRVKYNPSVRKLNGRADTNTAAWKAQTGCGIQQLEKAIDEFKGTEQQMILIQELLYVFKYEKLYDRYLDLFLRTLYEHPTERLVARCAREAVPISRAAGRDAELRAAYEHLASIPFEFPARGAITELLKAEAQNAALSK